MRVPIAIIAGAALIAASILVVDRYEIGRVAAGAETVTFMGIDQWTGKPFIRTAPRELQDFRQYGTPVN